MNIKHKYQCNQCKSDVYFQPSSSSSAATSASSSNNNNDDGVQTPTSSSNFLNIECNHSSGKIERIEDILNSILTQIGGGEDGKKTNTKSMLYLCNICMSDVFSGLSEQIEQLELECKLFDEKLKNSSKLLDDTNDMYNKYTSEMDELRNEELVLREKVNVIQNDRLRIGRNITSLHTEHNIQQENEENSWKTYFQLIHNHQDLEEENRIKNQWEVKMKRKAPLISGMFHLRNEGSYGTINGLRMGSVRHDPVSWEEINAAWGLCILLLDLSAQQFNIKFSKYKLVPKASCSTIKDLESGDRYDLFFSSTRRVRSFNEGMKCFLYCLEEVCQRIDRVGTGGSIVGSQLPIIKADVGKIKDFSIMYSVDREDEWTKALKYTIFNLKFVQKSVFK